MAKKTYMSKPNSYINKDLANLIINEQLPTWIPKTFMIAKRYI